MHGINEPSLCNYVSLDNFGQMVAYSVRKVGIT